MAKALSGKTLGPFYIVAIYRYNHSEVFKATHIKTGAAVALKRILMHNEFQGLPITAVREIKLLKKLKHPNVIELVDIVMELGMRLISLVFLSSDRRGL